MPNFMTFSRDRLVVLAECIRRKAQVQRPKSSVPSPASQVQRSAIPRGGRPLVLAARMVSFALVESRSPPAAAFLHRDPQQTLQAAFHADFYAAPGFRAEGRRRLAQ